MRIALEHGTQSTGTKFVFERQVSDIINASSVNSSLQPSCLKMRVYCFTNAF